jgi:hypothetical protein
MKSFFIFLLFVVANISFAHEWDKVDISFVFESSKQPLMENVVIDQIVKISPFEASGVDGLINPPKFRVIMGYGSLSLFNALKVDEVAGLKRSDAEKFIKNLHLQGKTEKDGAFIAGLTNLYNGREFFVFFNLERMAHSSGYAARLLAHEPLHMARLLITTIHNPQIDYINEPWVNLTDDNEEYFAEMIERISAVCSYYFKIEPNPSLKN